jgi:TonB family protein
MITRKRNGKGWLQAIGLAVLAGVALAVACETPSPTDSPESEQEGTVAPAERSAEASGEATGDLELPIVDNGRIRLSTGTSCAKYLIDGRASTAEEVGALDVATIHRVEVVKGEAAGEDAPCGTIRVVTEDGAEGGSVRQYEAQAQPAAAGERAGAATERAGAATERAGALPAETQGVIQEREAVRSEASDVASKPTFTPMTQAPKLTNGPEVQQLLADYYPPLLRDAGIGGTANVWFFIDETGHVVKAQIKEPSGHDALDQAALAVARQMEFEPAMNRDKRVPAWVALDITFEVQ